MKDFDKAAAKHGATVCTIQGWSARILCFDKKGGYGKIVAALLRPNGEEDVAVFYDDGRYYNDDASPFDLMMADDDYLEKLERGEYDHIEDNLEMVGKSDHIGEATEKVDWEYWRRMYAGMAMQGFCRENGTMKSANMVASVSVEYADALIKELKKTQK